MICASLIGPFFIVNILRNLAEKISLLNTTNFRGRLPIYGHKWARVFIKLQIDGPNAKTLYAKPAVKINLSLFFDLMGPSTFAWLLKSIIRIFPLKPWIQHGHHCIIAGAIIGEFSFEDFFQSWFLGIFHFFQQKWIIFTFSERSELI